MNLKHSFIYYGTFDDLGPKLADMILDLEPTRVVDPFAGGCKLPYTLATLGIPVAVSDIHHYCRVSAQTILADVPEVCPPDEGVRVTEGYMTTNKLGMFNDDVRKLIDTMMQTGDIMLQAAAARSILHYARGWSGWETMVGRQKVVNVPVPQVFDDVNESLALYSKRRARVSPKTRSANVVDQGDGFGIVKKWLAEGLIGPGTVVVSSPPGLWRSKQIASSVGAEKTPFGFYTEIDNILCQKTTDVDSQLWRWDNEGLVQSLWSRLQDSIRECVEAGATVMIEKSSTHAPWPPVWDRCPEPMSKVSFPEKKMLANIGGEDQFRFIYCWGSHDHRCHSCYSV